MTREEAIPIIHAYWIKRFYNCYECSNCHNLENMLTKRTNYCKDCGAKMDKKIEGMTDYKKYINALRKCAKEHEKDVTFTGHINVSDLCKDTAELLETLERESSYNSLNSLVESKLKNPKAKTFDILHFVADNAGLSTFEAIEKAYNMGVSEQESILDKIRAEIEQVRLHKAQFLTNDNKVCIDSQEVLNILDKYKAESEVV